MKAHTEKEEQKLIQNLKRGDHKAFNRIYDLYAKRLYSYCLQYTKQVEDAKERVGYHDFLKRFHTALSVLPDTQQKVIKLSRIKQWSNKEISCCRCLWHVRFIFTTRTASSAPTR